MVTWLRRRLAVKLFISYLVVIVVGILIQAVVVEVLIPEAFQRHMMSMQSAMGMMAGTGRTGLLESFRAAVNEALAAAGLVAALSAFVVSIFISRQVVSPVQSITRASLRIADGHFAERVQAGDKDPARADELDKLAHAFNLMAERLEHTEQMRRQLLGDVSHELRTPLTAIKGSMEALTDGVLPAEPATFAQIELEADRLQRLVNDLQELSRVEAGAYVLERLPVAVAELAQTAARQVDLQFRQKEISLQLHLAPALPAVQGDPDRLLQVLLNLLNNACQYTPAGGSVTLEAAQHGPEILFSVKDTGIGIPAEHIPHLFTRFYRVDKSRSRQAGGGSGIGLTICRYLVEAHGGRIWAQSPGPGQGAAFFFTLPAQG